MKLLVSTVAPFAWVRLDKHDRPVEKGQFREAAFLNTIPAQVSSVIGVAPAVSNTIHRIAIPTKNRANMLAALPYSLEDSLSEDLEHLHFSVLNWVPGGDIDVMVVSRDAIAGWIEVFADAGVKLDAIISEHALLPIHPDCTATIAKQAEDQFIVKTDPYLGFVLDQDAFDAWWSLESNQQLATAVNDQALAVALKAKGGTQISHWAIGDDFRSWMEQVPAQLKQAVSMLQGEFEPLHLKPGNSLLTIAATIVLLALGALGVSNWVEAERLQQQYESNQQDIRSLFDEAFPDEEYLDRPRRQIASLLSISEDQPASEMFQYLLSVAADVVPENQAELEEVNYRDEQMQLGVSAPNFSTLDQITAQINARDNIQAALISSGTRDRNVIGQIKLMRSAQ